MEYETTPRRKTWDNRASRTFSVHMFGAAVDPDFRTFEEANAFAAAAKTLTVVLDEFGRACRPVLS